MFFPASHDGASSLGHFSFFSCIRSKKRTFRGPSLHSPCREKFGSNEAKAPQIPVNLPSRTSKHAKMLSVTVTRLPESRLPCFVAFCVACHHYFFLAFLLASLLACWFACLLVCLFVRAFVYGRACVCVCVCVSVVSRFDSGYVLLFPLALMWLCSCWFSEGFVYVCVYMNT